MFRRCPSSLLGQCTDRLAGCAIIHVDMKRYIFVLTAVLFLFAGYSTVLAQDGEPAPPPPAAPDYGPKTWKEYSYPDDNIRFRFPVEPAYEESTMGDEKQVIHTYTRQSFILFQLNVMVFAADLDLEADERILEAAVRNGLSDVGEKVLTQEDVSVDGHRAKFITLETADGMILRWKCFAVKNKIYVASTETKKGDRHGYNSENDFEIPSMAFLDSLHVIDTKWQAFS